MNRQKILKKTQHKIKANKGKGKKTEKENIIKNKKINVDGRIRTYAGETHMISSHAR